jgi:hypothetical protein
MKSWKMALSKSATSLFEHGSHKLLPKKRFIDGIREGCINRQHPNLVLMGQDIAEYGGAFKITGKVLAVKILVKKGTHTPPFAAPPWALA